MRREGPQQLVHFVPGAGCTAPVEPGTPPAAGAPPGATAFASSAGPLNLSKLFAEVDKFCDHILSFPGAANHPEIQQQFAFLTGSKEQMLLAHAESAVHRKIDQARLAALEQGAKQRQDAHRKKVDELNKPFAALDGDALGRSLLKNVGLVN